jgi:ubiquinone/menaquinone biosynthesis C-methylase UbiE
MRIFATEISEDVCDLVRRRMATIGYDADVRIGENRRIPFDDNTFDFLVSWNTIHYEPNADQMTEAIREYARVLKPRGRFFISTTGPEHLILEGATSVGPNRYKIAIDDFRRGQTFFYFDNPSDVHRSFDPHFRDVLVGRTRDELFSKICDFWLITGEK